MALRGKLPDRVLQRTDKADFMVTFRRSLNELPSSKHIEWVDRRNWVLLDEFKRMCEMVGDPHHGGIPEWQVWTLLGCCALTSAHYDGG
jgi:hypothetical protein